MSKNYKKPILNVLLAILAYIIIFVIPFAFLKTYDFGSWKYASFVQAVIGTFMGGGTIAIITAALLVFSKRLEAEHNRKQKIYSNRIEFYQKTVSSITEIISDKKIEPDELIELEKLWYELALISEEEIQDKFLDLIDILRGADFENDEEYKAVQHATIELIDVMSESLGFGFVHKDENRKDSELDKLGAVTISSGNKIEEIQKDSGSPDNKFLSMIDKIIQKNKLCDSDKGKRLSKTGGISYYKNNKKFLQIAIGRKIEILVRRIPAKDNKYSYVRPKSSGNLVITDIREYSPNKAKSYIIPWGYSFFKILIEEREIKEDEKDFLKDMILRSSKAVEEGKELRVSENTHDSLRSIFTKGDDAEGEAWDIENIGEIL